MKMIKNFVILGVMLVGLSVGSGCSTTTRGHNFYRTDGFLGRNEFSSTKVIFTNKVKRSVAYLYWDDMPLCIVRGGPRNTIGLSYGEKFRFEYNSPWAEAGGLSLSVEFMDETESRSLNNEIFSEVFPVFYRQVGTYNWNFWDEKGRIHWKTQSFSGGGYGGFGRFGYW